MEPIRQLTRKDVPWNWSHVQDDAFAKVKQLVTEAPGVWLLCLAILVELSVLAESLVYQCDASEKGLGAALLQHGKPVAYASRALTETEQRYAQIEKEMLAIVFSLEKFHQYTYGRKTHVHSDHKPLEAIVKKPLAKAPKRLQGMLLCTQKYDINVTYLQGKHMYIADMLSRAYLPEERNCQTEFEQINMVSFLPIRDERLQQISKATEQDDVSNQLRQTILQGWPDNKTELPATLHQYHNIRDEMTVQDGLVYSVIRCI